MNENLTFESLVTANSRIGYTNIRGTAYASASEKIKAFRTLLPSGSITTEVLRSEDGICIMKATVMDGEGKILGTGHAYEKENSSSVNKSSFLENCETSAIGRALTACGIGIKFNTPKAAGYKQPVNAQGQQAPTYQKPAPQYAQTPQHPQGNFQA